MDELSNAVGSNYVIVRNIIRHLTWREIKVAEKVCVLWQQVVNGLRKTQLHVQSFHFTYSNDRRPVPFVASKECLGIPELLIVLQRQFEYTGPFRCPLDPCPKTFKRSRVCPYCTENALFKHACSFCNSDTKVLEIMSPGIMCLQSEKIKGEFMGGLAIPKIPGVQVDLLNFTSVNYSDPSKFFLELNKIMDKNIVKCLLIYATTGEDNEQEEEFVTKIIADSRTKQKKTHPTHQIAVCGCITHNPIIFPTQTYSEENITKVLVFSVNKSDIDSAQFSAFSSVFLPCSESERVMENEFKNQMKKISDLIPRRKYGIIIKISCSGISLDPTFENDVLAEHFPNMPIVICESSLEIGVDCLPSLSNDPSDIIEAQQDLFNDYVHVTSTVILSMSWGQLL